MKNDDDYAYGLDALRFLCAVFVAVFHFTWRNPEAGWLMPFGWIGVQIFFVISGIVIASSASNRSARDFLIGRFLRLYPAAWICGAVSFFVLLTVPADAYSSQGVSVWLSLRAVLNSFSLVTGLVSGGFLASSYWTLPIELSFYILIFLSLFTNGRVTLVGIARALIVASAPYLILLGAHSAGWIHWPWLDFGYGPRNVSLVRHGPFFALGIYIWLKVSMGSIKVIDHLLIGAAFALAVIEISLRSIDIISEGVPISLAGMITVTILLFAFALGGAYISMRYRGSLNLPTAIRIALRTAGLMTYPLYLLHEVVGGFVLYQLQRFGVPFSLRLLIAVLVVGFVAHAVCKYAEPWFRTGLSRHITRILATDDRFRKYNTLHRPTSPRR